MTTSEPSGIDRGHVLDAAESERGRIDPVRAGLDEAARMADGVVVLVVRDRAGRRVDRHHAPAVQARTGVELRAAVLVEHQIPFRDAASPVPQRPDDRHAYVVGELVTEGGARTVAALGHGHVDVRIGVVLFGHRALLPAVAVERHTRHVLGRRGVRQHRERVGRVLVVIPREDPRPRARRARAPARGSGR